MGGFISRIRRLFISKRDVRMLMNGLDAAGKTTILYKLKLGEVVTTIPTIGFNVETVEYRNIAFTVWDVGGRDKIRPLWRHYYQNTNALIWVVDSNDRERLDNEDYGSTKEELHKALAEDELRDAPLLVFANKQDLPNALSTSEICQRLGLHKLRNRQWFIQGCCATTGDGLFEGLEWLSEAVKRQASTPSRKVAVPVAAPVPVPAIEPQPRKTGPLGVMDAISSENPNAFAVHALEKLPTPVVPTAAALSSAVAEIHAASTTVNGVPTAPPMTPSSLRYVAPRAASTTQRSPVSSRLFPSFSRSAEDHLAMRAASSSLESLITRQAETEPGSDLVVAVPATKLDDAELVEKQQPSFAVTRRSSFEVKHSSPLQVRYPLSELSHPLSKSEALLNDLTKDSRDSRVSPPPSRKRSLVADAEFVIVERIEEEEELVVVQPGEAAVKVAMVEC